MLSADNEIFNEEQRQSRIISTPFIAKGHNKYFYAIFYGPSSKWKNVPCTQESSSGGDQSYIAIFHPKWQFVWSITSPLSHILIMYSRVEEELPLLF